MEGPLTSWTATTLSKAIHTRQVSCREVMQAYLKRIDEINPTTNAIVARQPTDKLLQQADECDTQLARGQSRGPLHGFPMAIKDLAPTKGIVTTSGCIKFKNFVPTEDALHVAMIREAGAIIIGKTNVPELGLGSHTYNPVYGPTRNAFDHSLSAGGSSGGAAVALALDMVPLADGSDTMGSLRNPAAWNQVYGFRPSWGLIPRALDTPELFIHQISTHGPMARNPEDLEMLLNVMARSEPYPFNPFSLGLGVGPLAFDTNPETALPDPIRVGWLGDLGGYLATDPELLAYARYAVVETMTTKPGERLSAIQVDENVSVPYTDFASLFWAWCTLRSWGCVAIADRITSSDSERRSVLGPQINFEYDTGCSLSARDIHAASVVGTNWWRALCVLFEKYDFLILPATQCFPFPVEWRWPEEVAGKRMDTYHRWMEGMLFASIAGIPVISVPVGFAGGSPSKPVGVQVMAPKGNDAKLIAFAKKIHAVFSGS